MTLAKAAAAALVATLTFLVLRWLSEVVGRPLAELEDAYSTALPPDPYVDTFFGRALP